MWEGNKQEKSKTLKETTNYTLIYAPPNPKSYVLSFTEPKKTKST